VHEASIRFTRLPWASPEPPRGSLVAASARPR